jgi:hypothetical protein
MHVMHTVAIVTVLACALCVLHSWLDGFDPIGDAAMEKRIKKIIKQGEAAAEVQKL